MGFPVGYTEVFLPKIFIHLLTFLGLIRSILQSIFNFLGLSDFLEPSEIHYNYYNPTTTTTQLIPPISAFLIRELLLPPVIFSVDCQISPTELPEPERCAVCLYEYQDGEEIRWLSNCKHIFHKTCLDRWMDYDQKNCPLCRTPLLPPHLQDHFNQRLWAATAIQQHDDFHIAAGM